MRWQNHNRAIFLLGLVLVVLGGFASLAGIATAVGHSLLHRTLTEVSVGLLVGVITTALPATVIGGMICYSFAPLGAEVEPDPWSENPWPE